MSKKVSPLLVSLTTYNMTGKKRKKEYVDPFKAFELEREANAQRLLKDRKLVVIKGATAANSGTTPETLIGEEKLKFKKSTSLRKQQPQLQHAQSVESGPLGSKSVTHGNKTAFSSIRESIMTLQGSRDTSRVSRAPFSGAHVSECVKPRRTPTGEKEKTRIGVQKLGSLIRESEFSKAASKRGLHVGADHTFDNLLLHLSFSETQLLTKFQVYSDIYRLLAWFKNSRFELINTHDNIDELRDAALYKLMQPALKPRLETSLKNLLAKATEKKTDNAENGIISSVINMRYVPKDLRRNKIETPPTHIVESAKRVGIYMVGAKVKDVQTKESTTVLLMRPGSRITLVNGDLLSLPDEPNNSQLINKKRVPVYLTFQLFRGLSSNH